MATIALTEETFSTTVGENSIVLIDFWASWCGPCRTFAPVFESVSEANPDIVFAKVDTEAEFGLVEAFKISSIPTLTVVREGVVLYSESGALPVKALADLIQAVRNVDMDEVRKSIVPEPESSS